MIISDFNHAHIPQALELMRINYEEERKLVPELPAVDKLPELKHFAENNLGAAAMEGDRLVGYLCAYYPREDVFGTTGVRGTFSPMHAHGVIMGEGTKKSRDRIYSLLYQEAAKKWVQAGIRSHAIAVYTHDKEAVNSFFYNGFGLRCIDAVNSLEALSKLEPMIHSENRELHYEEMPRKDWGKLLDQHNALIAHLANGPAFMRYEPIDEEELYRRTSDDIRYFIAKDDDRPIAYLKVGAEGENFATMEAGMMNICGAYCEPDYRGLGIFRNLLSYMVEVLQKDGYQILGVDCESFNPNARGFWLKYFHEYTHSLVRRIDEKIFD